MFSCIEIMLLMFSSILWFYILKTYFRYILSCLFSLDSEPLHSHIKCLLSTSPCTEMWYCIFTTKKCCLLSICKITKSGTREFCTVLRDQRFAHHCFKSHASFRNNPSVHVALLLLSTTEVLATHFYSFNLLVLKEEQWFELELIFHLYNY
jgi:hypothetical protein